MAVIERSERFSGDAAASRRARRLVAEALDEAGRDDLVDAATLAVSEVVTNALLHAGTDIDVRCRVSQSCLRVEVADGSPTVPSPRRYEDQATTGRGLDMVDLLTAAWGVEVHPGDGKTIWFELGEPEEPADCGGDEPPTDAEGDRLEVTLCSTPVALALATLQYGEAALRELALLALSGDVDEVEWHSPRFDVTPLIEAIRAAQERGEETADLTVSWRDMTADAALERLALVDEADRLAQADRLLVPAAVPEVGACRRWIYRQIATQAQGSEPERWELPEPADPAVAAAELPPEVCDGLEELATGAVVADDANRIVFVNPAAAALLGWEGDDLLGRRLTALIPPALREAHLAGFTRYQLTGEARLLGRPVRVPALRQDGTTVDVELTIEELSAGGGRTVFRATLDRVD